ncbi:methyltransferase [Candidatus Woesearchaeota archaeon]|nr:methyltransferase [Candidatus Woesearchaeota archaeon]
MDQKTMSKGALAIALSKLDVFPEAKVRVEQYPTDPEVAAEVLWDAHIAGDMENKAILDLGAGTGILGLGCLLLGARKVTFIDADQAALAIAEKNYAKLKSEISGKAAFVAMDIHKFQEAADVVVENPPFGTKTKHADREFLEKAFTLAPVIYTFHKASTSAFINQLATQRGFNVEKTQRFAFPLKRTMPFHAKNIKRISVDCFRLRKPQRF